jgi:Spy/CpxP family protein refolding chaperone
MLTLGAALLVCAPAMQAQRRGRPPQPRPNASAEQQQVDRSQRRAQLEQAFRERGEQVVRQRLGLNDDQMRRFRDVNGRISSQRNALVQQERDVRVALRDEMAKGTGADQAKVADLMNQARQLQQQRFALQQDEQQQLSQFLTPVQVAQYMGLQAQIRERLREMRMQQGQNPGAEVP